LELFVDVRWLLDRQERVLGKDLQIRDYSALVAAVARHRVNTPHLDVGEPDAYWRAAALLDTIVLQRPLPARNELYGYGVAVAYIEASGETVAASEEQWIQLIEDIKALRLDTFDIADRLRS
jgi:prophage maintenance system killer protein